MYGFLRDGGSARKRVFAGQRPADSPHRVADARERVGAYRVREASERVGVLIICLLLGTGQLMAQQISLGVPANATVCGASSLNIVLENDSDEALLNPVLSLQLPPCFTLPNLADPTNIPLDNLPAGSSMNLEFAVLPGCDCLPLVNEGELFSYSATLNYEGGSVSGQSAAFEIETPLLVITNVSNTFLVGSKGQVLQRSITIQNTRLGPLSSFVFRDQHQGGLWVTANAGTVLSQSDQHLEIELGGLDFESIGNGNALFEFNESITITETIEITSCGLLQNSSLSSLQASWGCEGSVCQQTSKQALVQILPSTLEPELVFQPFGTGPGCFCDDNVYEQGLQVTNLGADAALNLFLQVQLLQDSAGLLASTVVLDSAGISLPVDINPGSPLQASSNGCSGDDAFRNLVVLLPLLSPGHTVTLRWQQRFCSNGCNSSAVRWRYKSGYEKPCPPGGYESSDFIVFDTLGIPGPQVNWAIPGTLPDQSQVSAPFSVTHDSLSSASGFLHLKLTIPCAASWSADNNLLLGGQAPSSVSTFPLGNGAERITAVYALPFPDNQLSLLTLFDVDCGAACLDTDYCLDSIQSSCPLLDLCGDDDEAPKLAFDFEVSLDLCGANLASCGLKTCGGLVSKLDCAPDSICLREPPGYFLGQLSALRTNFGDPDLNNDRLPDAPGTLLDTSLIRRDRLIPGDTLLLDYQAGIFVDQPAMLRHARIDFALSGANFDPFLNGELLEPTGWDWLYAELELYQAATGTWLSCPDINPELLLDGSLVYRFYLHPDSLAQSGCSLPINYQYAQGDSVRLRNRLRLKHNLLRELPAAPGPPIALVFAEARATFFEPAAPEQGFFCGCGPEVLEVTGVEAILLPGLFAVPPCDTSTFSGASLVGAVLGAPNFFPFEIRPLLSLEELQLFLPPTFTLVDARLLRLDLQNGPTLLNTSPLSWITQGDTSLVDLSSLPYDQVDEGFSALLQWRFTADCQIQSSYPLALAALFDNLPGAQVLEDTLWKYAESATALRALLPGLGLNISTSNNLSSDNQGVWEFSLQNNINTIAGQSSGTAPQVWVYPQSSSGLLHSFQLLDPATLQPFPSENGIFQLGDLDTLALQNLLLIAQNSSCLPEVLQLNYGWNCSPYTNPQESACYTSSLQLGVSAPPGELEMQVFGPGDCALLCDTIGYHTVRLTNAGQGAQCSPFLNLFIQNGFQLLPGSVQIAYPAGTGFVPAPDPLALGNGLYQWALASFNTELDSLCLPGLGAAPYNELELRFLGLSDCGFVANSKLIFRAGAQQICGTPSNLVVRQSPLICIELEGGIPEGFVNVQLAQPVFCADTVLLNMAMLADAVSQASDSLEVWLPSGLTYVPGSFSGIANPPPGMGPLLSMQGGQQILRWGWPENLPVFNPSSFQIALSGLRDLPCELVSLTVRTTRLAEAVCALSGDTCAIQVETGSTLFNLPIERPSYALSNLQVQANADGTASFNLELQQSGPVFNEPVLVDIYLDLDGNGQPSPGDSLLLSLPAGMGLSGTQLLSGALPPDMEPADWCRLLAWVDPAQHCLCSSVPALVQLPVAYEAGLDAQLCSGSSLAMELCLPGFQHQWSPSDGWGCDTCCTSVFSWTLSGTAEELLPLVWEASQGGCLIRSEFEVLVTPLPGIAYADTLVCFGQPANLLASPAQEVFWTGPGIADPSQEAQSPVPAESALYTVLLTDSLGCFGSDSVWVQVLPPIQADSGEDLVFCPGEVPQLQPSIDGGLQYLWSPAYLLEDPTQAQALLLEPEDGVFYLTLTDAAGCQVQDSVMVRFAENPVLAYEAERLLCAGTADTLVVSGAQEYIWEGLVDCLNPPLCSQVLVMPDSSTSYPFTAISEDGCEVSGAVWLEVIEESLTVLDTLQYCAGELATVFGVLTSESGRYCDTLVGPGGCLLLECLDLVFADTFRAVLDTVVCPGEFVVFLGELLESPGLYWWEGSTAQGCDSLLGLDLRWHPVQDIILSQDSLLLRKGTSTEVSVLGTAASWLWFPPEGLSCDDCPEPEIAPLESTLYTLLATDANGCVQQQELWVEVEVYCELEEIQLPNAFTPNNDGLNDTFGPVTPEGLEYRYELQIFDRWGQQIFRAEDQPWDGTHQGFSAPMENYVYSIRLRCANGAEETRRGSLLLIR
jgi:gliding motility-associated-like protein